MPRKQRKPRKPRNHHGSLPKGARYCPNCFGSGVRLEAIGGEKTLRPCPICHGQGYLVNPALR